MTTPTAKYLNLYNSLIRRQDLVAAVQEIVGEALPSFSVADQITFTSNDTEFTGKLRYNAYAGSPVFQYSTDSGATWTTLDLVDYAWNASRTYTAGTPVLYAADGSWYLCMAGATGLDIPGASAKWKLLTLGSVVWTVKSSAQLESALESGLQTIVIYIQGTIANNVSATLEAETGTVVIYSDESATIESTSIALTTANGCNVYWHSSGTRLSPGVSGAISIGVTNGKLWIDRLTPDDAVTTTLIGSVYYQRIDGTVLGGTNLQWCSPLLDSEYVPQDLSVLETLSYSDNILIYGAGTVYGKLTAGDFSDAAASYAARKLHIDAQGTLAQLPVSSTVFGYLYYATDTGDVYRWGGSAWDPPVHIQGPQGIPGQNGTNGTAGADAVSPTVTMVQGVTASTITIVDVTHLNGQSIVLANGETPTFVVGAVQTLTPGAAATVTMAYSTVMAKYTLNFGIPKGEPGDADYTVADVLIGTTSIVDDGTATIPYGGATPGVVQTGTFGITADTAGTLMTVEASTAAINAETDVYGVITPHNLRYAVLHITGGGTGGGGGSVNDVVIAGSTTSLVQNGTATIPKADVNRYGLVMASTNSNNGSYGICLNNGILTLTSASTNYITDRTAKRAITTNELNYAVTAALTDANHITLTAAQRATVQGVIGLPVAGTSYNGKVLGVSGGTYAFVDAGTGGTSGSGGVIYRDVGTFSASGSSCSIAFSGDGVDGADIASLQTAVNVAVTVSVPQSANYVPETRLNALFTVTGASLSFFYNGTQLTVCGDSQSFSSAPCIISYDIVKVGGTVVVHATNMMASGTRWISQT